LQERERLPSLAPPQRSFDRLERAHLRIERRLAMARE
jgi:hypothetical protein